MLGLQYLSDSGVTLEKSYRYVDGRSNKTICDAEKHERELNQFELSHYRIDPFNAEYQIMQHLNILNIPVAAAFRVGRDFRDYQNGVISTLSCNDEEKAHWHSAAIIGYGTIRNSFGKSVDYWLLKNSWADDWGEEGYVRIARGVNWCEVESQTTGARIPE